MKRLASCLWGEFAALWVVAVVVVLLFETGVATEGALVGNPRAAYVAETTGVLAMIALVPTSLKLFSVALKKRVVTLSDYHHASLLRLALLAIVVWGNLIVYYLTLNNLGGLSALIGLTATLFCLPSAERIENELSKDKNDDATVAE